jgi:RAB protein geranylgeranyltransferase component A
MFIALPHKYKVSGNTDESQKDKNLTLTQKENIMKFIKNVLYAVSEFFSAVALASYAAHQARNNQTKQAQSHYID